MTWDTSSAGSTLSLLASKEQRPWGSSSPDMGGIPPSSPPTTQALNGTKPSKEESLTLAFRAATFGDCTACMHV